MKLLYCLCYHVAAFVIMLLSSSLGQMMTLRAVSILRLAARSVLAFSLLVGRDEEVRMIKNSEKKRRKDGDR